LSILSTIGKQTIEFLKVYTLVFIFFLVFGGVALVTSIMALDLWLGMLWYVFGIICCLFVFIGGPILWKFVYPWVKKRDAAFRAKKLAIPGQYRYRDLVKTANLPHFVIFVLLFFLGFPALAVILFILTITQSVCFMAFGVLILSPFIVLCIAAPAMGWMSFIYARDKYEPEPEWALLLAFAWGMFATFPSFFVNSFNDTWFTLLLGFGGLSAILSAPIFEELFKSFGFIFTRKEIDNELDGLVYGVCFGVGFATVENFLYAVNAFIAGGTVNFVLISVIRGIFTVFLHIIGPALVGFAYGYAKRKGLSTGWKLVLVGCALAVGMLNHAIWNTSATILTNVCLSIPFMLFWSFLEVILVVVLLIYAIKIDRKMHKHLGEKIYVSGNWIPPIPAGRPKPPKHVRKRPPLR